MGDMKLNVTVVPEHESPEYSLTNPEAQSNLNDLYKEPEKKAALSPGILWLKHCPMELSVIVEKPLQIDDFQNVAHFGASTAGAGAGTIEPHAPKLKLKLLPPKL
jgi:hypothetical protein